MTADDSHEGAPWPLDGVRVLDLSTGIAGPYCTKLLVDAGARVIKLEHPARPDPLRCWSASGTPIPDGEDGGLFRFLNGSKAGVEIDPQSGPDRALLEGLIESVDIVVESGGPGALGAWGIEWPALHAAQPGLTLVSISPWGLEGPFATRPATDLTLQAAVGSIDYRGLPGRKPVFAGGRLGEWATGAFAAVGALSAALSARQSGAGQHVDVSMFETMVLSLTVYHDVNSQWVEGPLPRAIEIPSIEPTKDGWVGLCTITGQQWTDFCSLLGRQDIGEDERFLDGRARMEHFDFMRDVIHGWTREHTTDEVIELAGLMRIPAAPVGNGATLPEMDQMQARGVFERRPHGALHPIPPYRLSAAPLRPLGEAPARNAARAEVEAELRDARPGFGHASEPAGRPEPAERDGPGAAPALPLEGLRVVDLTCFWAGPMATSYLASMGADVVKVESIQRPDGMRFAGAARKPDLWEWSPVFHGANTGKRGITLRLDDDEGVALVRRLIAGADVVIENFSARVLENFGLGWEDVHALNPRAILVRMPAFGLDGPWRDRAGFAMTVEQVSGLAWITGYPDLPLVPRGFCDPVGGMHAVFALYAALEHRRRTGEGQLVEVPLVEVAMNLAAEQVIEHSQNGVLLSRDENRSPFAAPQGVYASADEEALVAVAIPDDDAWRSLCTLIGADDLAARDDLVTADGRRRHHDELDARIEAWTTQHDADTIVTRMQEAGLPAEHLVNAHALHPHAQLEHRRFFQAMRHPRTGETRYPGWPMRFSGWPRALHRRTPPTLGEHNDEVLADDLGLDATARGKLRERQVIGERPSFM